VGHVVEGQRLSAWQNWAGTEQARLARVVAPGDTGEVVAAVKAAARDGLRVTAVGAGGWTGQRAGSPSVLVRR
jgi:FAD/FMN-containing dehydrogenase